MQVVRSPGFEAPSSEWSGTGTFSTSPVYSGTRALRLEATFGFAPTGQSMAQDLRTVPGLEHRVRAQVRHLGSAPSGADTHRLVFEVRLTPAGAWTEVYSLGAAEGPAGVFYLAGHDRPGLGTGSAAFVPTGELTGVRARNVPVDAGGGSIGVKAWHVDELEVEDGTAGAYLGRSNLERFMTNLQAVVASVDPGIGPTLRAERRWSNDDDLKREAMVVLASPPLSPQQHGPAIRFWLLEPWIHQRPLTNGTDEIRGMVRLVGFYGFKADESQANELREAACRICDTLALRETEFGILATGMGQGYLGFLTERPAMSEQVRGAALQSGVQGHVATVTVSYFEEVER